MRAYASRAHVPNRASALLMMIFVATSVVSLRIQAHTVLRSPHLLAHRLSSESILVTGSAKDGAHHNDRSEYTFGSIALPCYHSTRVNSRIPNPCLTSADEGDVLDPDYRLPVAIATGSGLFTLGTFGLGAPLSLPFGALAAFLASRANKIRFVFREESLEIQTMEDDAERRVGQNFAVGGRNSWRYCDIIEWAMYPSPENPVLVYFRERSTRPSGQGHLFPVLADPVQLRNSMQQRIGEKKRVTGPPSL